MSRTQVSATCADSVASGPSAPVTRSRPRQGTDAPIETPHSRLPRVAADQVPQRLVGQRQVGRRQAVTPALTREQMPGRDPQLLRLGVLLQRHQLHRSPRLIWNAWSESTSLQSRTGDRLRSSCRRRKNPWASYRVSGRLRLLGGMEFWATCGHCGRRLYVHYQGRNASPGYHCSGQDIVQGSGVYCLYIGGVQIDRAVSEAVLDAAQPGGLEAALRAAERIEADHDGALEQWRLAVERARYEAERAERRYRAVEPENRLVARGLETEWEQRLSELEQARSELERRERRRPRELTTDERKAVLALGMDLPRVWEAPTTTARDKKELLRTLLDEVIVAAPRGGHTAHLTLRWRGGLLTELDIDRPQTRQPPIRTDEDTLELVRRLARHYPDAVIAGILSRQGKKTAYGHPFTAMHVGNLRRNWNLGRFDPATRSADGELVSIQQAAERLEMAPSTLHRWINDGFIAGEQLTPGAPWRIRITPELLACFVEQTPAGYVPMQDATRILGVSRQTVLQRVKRGELDAVHVHHGKRKGLRIKVIDDQATLFKHSS